MNKNDLLIDISQVNVLSQSIWKIVIKGKLSLLDSELIF